MLRGAQPPIVGLVSDPGPSRRLQGKEAVLHDPLVRELLEARLVCVLATYDAAGVIHAVPLWYAGDDSCVLLAAASRSRKVRNLEGDPRGTLVVHDSRPGYEVCGVSMAGRVAIVRGPDAGELVDRVHRRYVDEAVWGNTAVAAFLASDNVALRFFPESALTWDERGSEANVALRGLGGALPLTPTEPRP